MEKTGILRKISTVLSILALFYWSFGNLINGFKHVLIGVFYEILWLPMLAMFFVLPLINGYFILKKGNHKLNYFSLVLNLITILLVVVL